MKFTVNFKVKGEIIIFGTNFKFAFFFHFKKRELNNVWELSVAVNGLISM